MVDINPKRLTGKRGLGQEIATRSTDPNFYAALEFLPNPDPILRRMGKSQEAYDMITSDSHVMGDLRSVRSALLGFEWRVVAGGDDTASMRAHELCEKTMAGRPAVNMQWSDIIWSIADATFRGYSIHELVWKKSGNELMPEKVIDRPQKRFVFSIENELRLLTKNNMTSGEELVDKKWLITRHMASYNNPYGTAVFSSCIWPHLFKRSGFKYFAKFCEKYGIPKAIGKVPKGTPKDERDEFADALAQMVEDGVAVIDDDGSVEMLEHGVTGSPIQERLIDLCNREMSKALTSQTLTSEIKDQGSRAAAETHRERETTVNQSDRDMVADTINQLFKWITEINVAGAIPPKIEFYEEAQPRKEMAEYINEALKSVSLKKSEVYERLGMSPPEDDDDIIPATSSSYNPFEPDDNRRIKPSLKEQEFMQNNCPSCGETHFKKGDQESDDNDMVSDVIDQAIELDEGIDQLSDEIDKLVQKAEKEGLTVEEFQKQLKKFKPIPDTLTNNLFAATLVTYLQGISEVDQ